MFDKLGMIADLMGNAGKLRATIEKGMESLGQVEVEASSGGGVVTVKANGRLEVVSVRLDPSLLSDADTELLEDLIAAAVNAALIKAREAAMRSLGELTGGLPIPMGLFPNFGGGPPPGGGTGGGGAGGG